MMVIHEPSLRADLEEIMRTGRAHRRQKSLLYLTMVILAIGTRYALNDDAQNLRLEIDLATLQSHLMTKIEENLLDIIDQDDIGSIQACVLLGSLYFYHRRPKRCFVVNGAALKAAQALRLHKESTWGAIDLIEREVRRRVWWALYVCEG